MTDGEIDAVLSVMAEDAFVVLNWAKRQGFKREQQISETVSAFKKSLADANVRIALLS